jgi:RsiW-degrading membrane proteinase PrsW (M82 family)
MPAPFSEDRRATTNGWSRSRCSDGVRALVRRRPAAALIDPIVVGIGLLPVALFLAALILLDSYKLVGRRAVAGSIAWGVAAAGVALAVNGWLLGAAGLDPALVRRIIAPLLEETLKGALVIALIQSGRVGFLVDAGIHGFAAGTGFALVENLFYAEAMGSAGLGVWVVRGLGTAMMHGSATAMIGILGKGLSERHGSRQLRWFLPGLLVASAVHSLYNHFFLSPLLATALLLVAMPLLVAVVFDRSERATRRWLGEGLDEEVARLEAILSGAFRDTNAGAYLESLKARFPEPTVADMLCYLQIHLELSLRAKGLLLARAAGLTLEVDPSVRANVAELRFLERSIGPTGRRVLLPLLGAGGRDSWPRTLLGR